MRTTLNIDDHVLGQAKDDARAAGLTLGQFVERALQQARGRHEADNVDKDELTALPSIGGRLLIPLESMSNAEIHDFLDEGVPLDKLR